MILYEGNYSGILEPWRHYVPLKKDHSNMAEVVAVLRDPSRLAEIVQCAYDEIALNPRYSFAAAVAAADAAIEAVLRPEMLSRAGPYGAQEFQQATTPDLKTRGRRGYRRFTQFAFRLIFARLLGRASPDRRAQVEWRLRRIYRALRLRPMAR